MEKLSGKVAIAQDIFQRSRLAYMEAVGQQQAQTLVYRDQMITAQNVSKQ